MLACAAALDELIRLRREILHLADDVRDQDIEQALRVLAAGGTP
jgi:hypothetical protein